MMQYFEDAAGGYRREAIGSDRPGDVPTMVASVGGTISASSSECFLFSEDEALGYF